MRSKIVKRVVIPQQLFFYCFSRDTILINMNTVKRQKYFQAYGARKL